MHYDNCDYPIQPLLLKHLSSQIFLVLNILAAFDTFFKPPTAHLVLSELSQISDSKLHFNQALSFKFSTIIM